MQYRALLMGVIVAGCGSSRPARPVDAGVADSAADAASPDAPPDAPPDAACPSPGAPGVIANPTPPLTQHLQLAGNGTSTMTVWDIGGHSAWALYDGGGVVSHGDKGTMFGTLVAAGSHYLQWDGSSIDVFDGTTWNDVPFPSDLYAVSGSTFAGIRGADVVMFDGTTVTGPTPVTQHAPLAIGGDGHGGFAVITADANTATNVHLGLLTYDGTSWSSEVTIATADDTSYYFTDTTVVPFNGSWAVLFVIGDVANVLIESNGTWTRTQFANTASVEFALAANGSTLAVAGNAGFTAVYKNGAWTRHTLTAATADHGFPPHLAAFQSGFVVVYGGGIDIRGAIYSGTSWGSEVLFTSGSGSRELWLAVATDSIGVGFVNTVSTNTYESEVELFSAGSWGPVTLVGSGQSRSLDSPMLGVESDGIRTAYIEPGTAETMLASAGAWSTPDEIPVAPVTGEVLTAAIARGSNHHVLLAWEQVVAEQDGLFAAEYDGDHWGTPVLLAAARYLWGPWIATSGSTFVIGWGYGPDDTGYPVAGEHLARWTGTGIGPATTTFQAAGLAAGDSSFVEFSRYLTAGGLRLSWITSANGDTWSSPVELPAAENTLVELAGGPAGVVAVTMLDDYTLQARVWQGGGWSSAAMFGSYTFLCPSAVGTSTAAVVCVSDATTAQAAVFSNGAWTTQTLATGTTAVSGSSLATDGADFRLDIGASTGTLSTVLHNGAWSPTVTDPVELPTGVAAVCGQWIGVVGAQHDVVTATGAGAYAFDHATGVPSNAHVEPGGDRLDAFWISPTATSSGQAVLHVQLGL